MHRAALPDKDALTSCLTTPSAGADDLLEVFLKYCCDHADQVYMASMNLTKLPKN